MKFFNLQSVGFSYEHENKVTLLYVSYGLFQMVVVIINTKIRKKSTVRIHMIGIQLGIQLLVL